MIGPGTVIGGRYRLEERIASGGTSDVWRCVDEVLGRTVAVKILPAWLPEEAGFSERFRAEAGTMAAINHPGVAKVHDYGSDPAVGAYLVMEYVDGDALSRTLARVVRLTPARTMALLAQAADALHAAHEMGVVHREIKPGNLLVRPDGRLVLTGFGIAGSIGSAQLAAAGSVLGAASYISPEQIMGEQATPRSDIYALGVVAYQCLGGHLPFEGENPLEIAMRHVREVPPALPPEIPPDVRAIVERAMAKDPGARWASAADLAAAARATTRTDAARESTGHLPTVGAPQAPAAAPPPAASGAWSASQPPPPAPYASPPRASRRGFGFGILGPRRRRRSTSGNAPARGAPVTDGDERLSFTVAHPSAVTPQSWHTFLVVLAKAGLRRRVDDVLRRWAPELGDEPGHSSTMSASPLARGTRLTLVPSVNGLVFNPERVDVTWHEDVQEVAFRVSSPGEVEPGIRTGQLEVYAGTLLVAILAVTINVQAGPARGPKTTTSRAGTFDRVFASYSRRDASVVDACAAFYRALGVEVLMDRAELRSGDDWRSSLHKLISRSDVFQLYWSTAASISPEVEKEWRYALSLTKKGGRFIRPVFWQAPMPDVPNELAHIHFGRIDLEQITMLQRDRPAP